MLNINYFFFFFSSRRRHTRLQGDWSSDVCSSDLAMAEGKPSRFEWRRRGPLYRALLETTLSLRFDGIAGGAQQILEEALLRWTRLAHRRYGGERVALGGGVFMNVKANMLIADESWLGDLFVFPSCGDES